MAKRFKELRAKFGKVTGFPSDPRLDPFRKTPSGTETYQTGSFFIEQIATGSFSGGNSIYVSFYAAGGRAGVVIKNTFLSNVDNASVSLRKELLETCNLHTILDMPGGTFIGAGVKTVVLFFTKGESTKNIWYYQPNIEKAGDFRWKTNIKFRVNLYMFIAYF